MKHIVWKAFWNYEKEEKWLNEMSAKGMAMIAYSWCRYVFAEVPNNEYTYRIELLEKWPTHAESIAYLKFLEENGVECIATYMRWIYLGKKTSDGPFDIYSDIESKIKHFKRINAFWSTSMWVEFMAGFLNIVVGAIDFSIRRSSENFSFANLILGCSLLLISLFFFRLGSPVRKKIKQLQKEQAIRE